MIKVKTECRLWFCYVGILKFEVALRSRQHLKSPQCDIKQPQHDSGVMNAMRGRKERGFIVYFYPVLFSNFSISLFLYKTL